MSVQYALKIAVCPDSHDAMKRGYFYRPPIYKPIKIAEVVVIQNGTEQGGSTVDLILEDESGQKYVVMITGNMLKTIPC